MMQLFSFADLMEKAIDGTLMTDITANYMNVSVLKEGYFSGVLLKGIGAVFIPLMAI